jgi:small-conductance mechanosensitive channel
MNWPTDWKFLLDWIAPAAALVIAVGLGYLAKFVIVRKITQLSARTSTDLDDLIVGATQRHIPFWFLIGGALFAARLAPITTEHEAFARHVGAALFVLSLSFVAANLLTGLVERTTKKAGATFVSASLTRNVLRGAILVVGGMMVLSQLGVKIEPLLTALGVGSLAVALALQPTLSNLFAGLHITLAKPLRIGDFIELENGAQGYVVDIGWRATKLRQAANNLVIVPNARLVEMIAKNYSLPEPEQTIALTVGVSYASDLEHVERTALSIARELRDATPEAVKTFEPLVRFHTFNASSIDLDVVLRVTNFPDRALLVSHLLKRLKARFDAEKIEIPYPQQVVHQRED